MEKVKMRGWIALPIAAIIVFFGVAFSPRSAHADKFRTETSSSARGLGMGNAVINTERGSYSVFYNPANIAAKKTGTNIQVVNFQLEGNDILLGQIAKGKSPLFTNLGSIYPGAKDNPNAYLGGRLSVYPNITFRNFSVGMLYEVSQGALYRSRDSALRVKARNRFAPTAALGFRLFGGILRFGASVKLLTVGNAEAVVSAPINETNLDFKNYINSGTGLAKDAGITLTLPFRYLPSFSVVARDIGDTSFHSNKFINFGNGTNVPSQPFTVDLAGSTTVYMGKRVEFKFEANYRDLVNKMDGGRFRHVFVGGEMTLMDLIHIRSGLAHGYLTYGLGITTKKTNLEFAVYSEELDDRLRAAPDKRYVLQYTFSLFK